MGARKRATRPVLGQRGIKNPIRTKLFQKALGCSEHSSEGTHVLTEYDHSLIPLHLNTQCVVDRLNDIHHWHESVPA